MKKTLTSEQVQEIMEKLGDFLEKKKIKWDQDNPKINSWLLMSKNCLVKSTTFLIDVTDSLVQFVNGLMLNGPEKKAAVLLLVANVFDYISVAAFPIWLKPFVPLIKKIVVSVVISNFIEFIVNKYKEGTWKPQEGNGKTSEEKN